MGIFVLLSLAAFVNSFITVLGRLLGSIEEFYSPIYLCFCLFFFLYKHDTMYLLCQLWYLPTELYDEVWKNLVSAGIDLSNKL